MAGLFRYSGNKSRLLKHYRTPPPGTKRVVETYLGSGAFLLAQTHPGLGYDTNGDLVAMWHWLQKCTRQDLLDLNSDVEKLKLTESKPDVRKLGLALGPQTYVRINTTGVLVGQLTAWRIYPQNKLPVDNTSKYLEKIRDVEVIHGDASLYQHWNGDLLFVDPPYVGTTGGYVEKGKGSLEARYKPQDTVNLIDQTTNPVILTYGDGAQDIFPSYDWQLVATRKVPNVRRGGTVDRSEYVAYVNW